jgi:hypothetical protein
LNPPPEGLSERSQAIWRAERRSKSAGRQALLEQCLRALDRADEFRRLLAGQELVSATKSTGALHINPFVKAEREARETFARLAKALGLEWEHGIDGTEE